MTGLRRLGPGVCGALAMLLWSLLMPPSLAQVMEDRLLAAVPGAVFGFLLDRLEFLGKPLLYVGLLLLQVAIGAAAGLLLHRMAERTAPARAAAGAALGILAWALGAALLGHEATAVSVLAGDLIFGVVAGLTLPLYAEAPEEAHVDPGRRRLIAGALTGGLAVLAAAGAVRTLTAIGEQPSRAQAKAAATLPTGPRPERAARGDRAAPVASQVSPPRGLTPAITPNADFYVVSKNFVDPVVNATNWTLEVGGPLATKPLRLTYDQLRALPSVSHYVTLECISNDVGGHLISNALWTGVPLGVLLQKAGVKDTAKAVAFTCVDGYTESLKLARAQRPETLVAYAMNGQPLPDKHGFPARIVTVGLFGMKNPKWLKSIAAVSEAPTGYWEQQGWSAEAGVPTMSRIDVPDRDQRVADPFAMGGIAFAGDRGIAKVEVSLDGGRTWLPAKLEKALSKDTWVLWYLSARAPAGGYTALVRAIDGSGAVQMSADAASYPAGATGYASTSFQVSG